MNIVFTNKELDKREIYKHTRAAGVSIKDCAVLAVDVRPVVRGKWIETKTGFHCSACKTKAKGTKNGALLSNYCPNCGADMRN